MAGPVWRPGRAGRSPGRADHVAFDTDCVAQLGGRNNDGRVHRITIDFVADAETALASVM